MRVNIIRAFSTILIGLLFDFLQMVLIIMGECWRLDSVNCGDFKDDRLKENINCIKRDVVSVASPTGF